MKNILCYIIQTLLFQNGESRKGQISQIKMQKWTSMHVYSCLLLFLLFIFVDVKILNQS